VARVLVDTSAVYALLDRGDAFHKAAGVSLEGSQENALRAVPQNFIVAECHDLTLARLGASLARKWLLENGWAVERITPDDEATAREIIRRNTDKTCRSGPPSCSPRSLHPGRRLWRAVSGSRRRRHFGEEKSNTEYPLKY
jgi:hypothetical protein